METSKTPYNDKNVNSTILTLVHLLLFEKSEKDMLHWSHFVI